MENTTIQVSRQELYKHLAILLQSVIEKTELGSNEVAKLIRYLQRCKNDGELSLKTAPNVINVLGIIAEKGSELFEVSSAELIKITDKASGSETTYVIKKNISYGRKYSHEKRRATRIPIQNDEQPVEVAFQPQNESAE